MEGQQAIAMTSSRVAEPLSPSEDHDFRAVSIVQDEAGLTVTWSNGASGRFLYFWLRENCPEDANSLTGQRLLNLGDIPDDIRPTHVGLADGSVCLNWPDGRTSVHDPVWLYEQRYVEGAPRSAPLRIQAWDSSLDLAELRASYDELMSDDEARYEAMERIVRFGLLRISGTPKTATESLAKRFGYLHDTNYGVTLDVRSEVKAWFRVLSKGAIPPHTDNAYRYTPTGITFFHCVEQIRAYGGQSYYVDGLKLAERIREIDEDAFNVLCNVPLTFHRHIPENTSTGIDAAYYKVEAPVFRLNANGQVVGLRYHPRTVAPFVGSETEIRRVYRARKVLEDTSLDHSLRVQFQANVGECTVYDNQRVMHARTSFEEVTDGVRHFRQCHIDREELHSRLRLLGMKLGRRVPEEQITPGASF